MFLYITRYVVLVATLSSISTVLKAAESTQKPIADARLVKILNNGKAKDLNTAKTSFSKNVKLILYSVPVSGDCVPETEATCQYEYYLAISEYDENPVQAVYELGTYGEIDEMSWLSSKGDSAELKMTYGDLPKAIAAKSKAKRSVQSKVLKVSSKELVFQSK